VGPSGDFCAINGRKAAVQQEDLIRTIRQVHTHILNGLGGGTRLHRNHLHANLPALLIVEGHDSEAVFFGVDRQGRIVGKNLYSEALEQELKKIL
jgi:hypothetical protein